MKSFLLFTFFSLSSYAHYSKPQLVARYSGIDAFNAPDGLSCFRSEPQPTLDGVFLGCVTDQGYVMMKWNPAPEVLALSQFGMFSHPKEVLGKTNWYEFSEAGVNNLFEYQNQSLTKIELKNLGPIDSLIDSFSAIKNKSYVYRLQNQEKTLQLWNNNQVSTLYTENISHIFPPVSSVDGNFLIKIRRNDLNEGSPDELLLWNDGFRKILEDRDTDSSSAFKAFRHQYAIDGETVAVIVTDDKSEALLLINGDKKVEVARAGIDLVSFDYFSPKLRNGILVFRGLDLKNQKSIWVYQNGNLSKLLTQGDVVQTDKGPARTDYQNQDAIFYGAPGIGPHGEIYLQSTLTDIDFPMTHMGIGLIRFNKE